MGGGGGGEEVSVTVAFDLHYGRSYHVYNNCFIIMMIELFGLLPNLLMAILSL